MIILISISNLVHKKSSLNNKNYKNFNQNIQYLKKLENKIKYKKI